MDATCSAPKTVRLSSVSAVAKVGRADWNRVANPPNAPYNPFVDWDFIDALERSGSVAPETGWAASHLLAHDPDGHVAGAMPLYVKSHSMGEFVFDHAWANAFEHAGGAYYPKLLCAIPFTPVTGPRVLVPPGPDAAHIADTLVAAAITLATRNGVSSCHFNFLTDSERERMDARGFLLRQDRQFHWHNRGYADFDGFLGELAARKRKNVRKERVAARNGLRYAQLTGASLSEEMWNVFYALYIDTTTRKWGYAPLNRAFFTLLHERMADKILMIVASDDDGRPIAAALNLIGSDALYGRYWGRREHQPFMHFETCYYQAIDYAITQGISRVEGGAQGEHKLARGYAPHATWSAHWIADDNLRLAVTEYLGFERQAVADQMECLRLHMPFRRCEAEGEQQ